MHRARTRTGVSSRLCVDNCGVEIAGRLTSLHQLGAGKASVAQSGSAAQPVLCPTAEASRCGVATPQRKEEAALRSRHEAERTHSRSSIETLTKFTPSHLRERHHRSAPDQLVAA